MTAEELRTLRAYPRHFDLDGLPICVETKTSAARAYTGDGQWETFPGADQLLVQGKLVSNKRFEALCRKIDYFIESGGPFLDAVEA
jgi:hypothetical protein